MADFAEQMSNAQILARRQLETAPGRDARAMLAGLSEVVGMAADLWQRLPRNNRLAPLLDDTGARRGGQPLASGELDRLVEQSHLLAKMMSQDVQGAGETAPSKTSGPAFFFDPRGHVVTVGLEPVIEALRELTENRGGSTDPVRDRAALMEVIHHSTHATNIAVGSEVAWLLLPMRARDSKAYQMEADHLRGYLRVTRPMEEIAASYGRRTRPQRLDGLSKDPVEDARGLGMALARLDVLTQRHLAGADRASDLALVPGMQATIYSGASAILAAGMRTGSLGANQQLLDRVHQARDTWHSAHELWKDLTPLAGRTPRPELTQARDEVLRALRDTLTPSGRLEAPAAIAERADLAQLTEVMHQHLSCAPLHAQLFREAALDPQMRYSAARGLDSLAVERQRRLESQPFSGLGRPDPGLERDIRARLSDVSAPLSAALRPEMERHTSELVRATTAAYEASGQAWVLRRGAEVVTSDGPTPVGGGQDPHRRPPRQEERQPPTRPPQTPRGLGR